MPKELWTYIRDKFPPARAVLYLTPIFLPILAYVNTWIASNAPWIDQYVSQSEREGIFVATIAAGVALAYKWLDGRSKWEVSQVNAHLALVQAGKSVNDLPPGVLEVGPITKDDDMILSEPADIAESDSDPPELDERREREELEGPQ